MEDFQELGVAYQQAQAHGLRPKDQSVSDQLSSERERVASMQAWKISVQDTVSVLKMPLAEQSAYIAEKRLCFNCLKPGHRVMDCKAGTRCSICKRKHHYLVHQPHPPKKEESKTSVSQEAKVQMVSCLNASNVRLMTAAVDVVGPNGKRKTV